MHEAPISADAIKYLERALTLRQIDMETCGTEHTDESQRHTARCFAAELQTQQGGGTGVNC